MPKIDELIEREAVLAGPLADTDALVPVLDCMLIEASYSTNDAVAGEAAKGIEQNSSAVRIIGGLRIGLTRWLRRLLRDSEGFLRSSGLFLVRKQESLDGIEVDCIE